MNRSPLAGLAALAVLAVAGAGGYALVRHEAALRLDRAIADLRAMLGTEATLRYESARAETFGRGTDFTGVSIQDGLLEARARSLRVVGAAPARAPDGTPSGVRQIDARDLRVTDGHATLLAAHARLVGFVLRGLDLATLRFDRAELEDAHATDDRSGIRTDAATLAANGYGRGAAGGIRAEGVDVALAQGGLLDRVRVGRYRVTGIDLAAWMAQARGLPAAADRPNRFPVAAEARDIALLKGGTTLATIAAIEAGGAPAPDGGRDSTLRAHGVEIDRQAAPAMAELGYENLRLDISDRQHDDPDDGRGGARLVLSPLRVAVADAGTLTLEAETIGLPTGAPSPQAMLAALPNARLVSVRIDYRDASLFGRVLGAAARRLDVPPESLRAQWRSWLDAKAGAAPPPAAALAGNLARFVDKPGTVFVALKPDAPLPLPALAAAFADPAALDALHLTSGAR